MPSRPLPIFRCNSLARDRLPHLGQLGSSPLARRDESEGDQHPSCFARYLQFIQYEARSGLGGQRCEGGICWNGAGEVGKRGWGREVESGRGDCCAQVSLECQLGGPHGRLREADHLSYSILGVKGELPAEHGQALLDLIVTVSSLLFFPQSESG